MDESDFLFLAVAMATRPAFRFGNTCGGPHWRVERNSKVPRQFRFVVEYHNDHAMFGPVWTKKVEFDRFSLLSHSIVSQLISDRSLMGEETLADTEYVKVEPSAWAKYNILGLD